MCVNSKNTKCKAMKKNYFLMIALFCASLFVACTDEDDDNGGKEEEPGIEIPDGNGNEGGESVEILPKKITKIVGYEDGSEFVEFVFEYDSDGRLIEQTVDGDWIVEIDYPTDTQVVASSSSGGEQTFYLEDGKATTCVQEAYFDFEREYVYSGGYLSRIDEDGDVLLDIDVEDGELVAISDDDVENTFTLSDVDNNAQIDLYGFILSYVIGYMDDEVEMDFYLGVTGERYRHLPSKIFGYSDDPSLEYTLSMTFDYEVDDEGYVTEIEVTYRDGYNSGEVTDTYTEVYEIIYED